MLELETLTTVDSSAHATFDARLPRGAEQAPAAAGSSFADRLRQAVAQADRTGETIAVQVLSVESTPDPAPDLSTQTPRIRAVAVQLAELVRSCDAWTYLGRGRFAILQRAVADPLSALFLAQKLVDAATSISKRAEHPRQACRVGLSLHTHGVAAEELLGRARTALEQARQSGKRISCLDGAAARQAAELSEFEALQRALQQGQLYLDFQPQINLRSGKVKAYEALIRWLHPRRGLLGPNEFIPLAESTGLVCDLGSWVLKEACRWRQRWSSQIAHDTLIAVNVAALQLADPSFPACIDKALEAARLPEHLLELELTETVAVDSLDDHGSGLARLHRRGIQLALDDFGTGFSSLQYLKLLRARKVKIPREFTSQAVTDDTSLAIVEAVVALGNRLGLEVVAEGIENPRELRTIQAAGCPTAQGFLFGRPDRFPLKTSS